MSIIKTLEKEIAQIITEKGYEIEKTTLLPSGRKDLGDYQINDAFFLAKKYKKNPKEIAESIKEALETDQRLTNINVAGAGFINLTITDKFLYESLNKIHSNIEENIDKQEKKKIIIDYGGANVAKALHVGHLRSANIGEALKRLARLLGHEVLADAHLGDYGRPLGLVLLEIQKRYPNLAYFDPAYKGEYKEISLPITNQDLEEIYPYASLKAKEDEEYLEQARQITTKLQHHEKGYYDLWKKVVEISKEDIKKVYDKLNVSFDLWQGESDAMEYFDELKQIFETKKLIKESNGAKIIEVKQEEENAPMPPLLLIRSNNSISYEATDLATILEREKKYHPDEIWYCVDGRQQLHFQQTFRAARLAKLTQEATKLEHIGFGTMNGKDKKPFKTRDGGVMPLKKLIELVKEETLKKINPENIPKQKQEEIAMIVAIASLKYADLLPFRGTDYIFEVEKFADLEGKTGSYILYSTIRMKSLLEKSPFIEKEEITKLENQTAREIAITILNLPQILTKALDSKSLNDITEYLYKLTSLYNTFYAENKILTQKDNQLKNSWITLTKIVYKINLLLLDILAIKVPEKM